MMTSHLQADRPTPQRRRAFTLIELLVVVTIIVLLISILLPSIKNAQEMSYLPTCANQMRQIFVGTFAYATDNANQMPPGQDAMGQGGMGIDATWRNNVTAGWPSYTSGTGQYGMPMGIGFPVMNGYITDAKVMYCPAWTHPYAQYDFMDMIPLDQNTTTPGAYGGWPAPGHPGPSVFRDISYTYRSSFGIDPNTVGWTANGGKAPNLRARANVVILSDHWFTRYFICWATYSHRAGGGGYEGLRLDGSTDWFSDIDNKAAIALPIQLPIGHNNGSWGTMENFWQTFFEKRAATNLYMTQ